MSMFESQLPEMIRAPEGAPVEWRISNNLVGYEEAVSIMEARVSAIRINDAAEMVWLLEHPALYTAGTSADPLELLDAKRFPVHQTGRGGRYTYHGPGQRVAYVMLDLQRRGGDIRRFVHELEDWVIAALLQFGIIGVRRDDRIGIWVRRAAPNNLTSREDKIAAIGLRVRHGISYHGIALNVEPELEHFSGIVPCGIDGHGVTSLWDLGITATMPEVDSTLFTTFQEIFGVSLTPVWKNPP